MEMRVKFKLVKIISSLILVHQYYAVKIRAVTGESSLYFLLMLKGLE